MIAGLGLIVVAAGSSQRMEGVDKVWARLGEGSVLSHSLRHLARMAQWTVVVVHESQQARARAELSSGGSGLDVVSGGLTRQDSVAAGLNVLTDATVVAVHDAARPFADPSLLQRGVDLVRTCDGAVPGIPVSDTIKRVDLDGAILGTMDRTILRAVQTPQVFRRKPLQVAHASEYAARRTSTDDAALLEACGFDVRVFPGHASNFKITTEYDLKLARLLAVDSSLS